MKVILIKDVDKLGLKGALVNVSDGYAQNYLFRTGLAKRATDSILKELEAKKASEKRNLEIMREDANKILSNINEKTIFVKQEIGENGKIHGSITSKDISEAVKEQLGTEIDKKKILLPDNINDFGPHECKIKFFPDIVAKIIVEISEKN